MSKVKAVFGRHKYDLWMFIASLDPTRPDPPTVKPTTLREPRPPPLIATTTTTVPIGVGRPLHQRQPSPIHLPHHESFV
ncbi:hypothetical protein Pmani_018138 [Petrolisthes manimaculis]|uniref:Uncharacterized protein n=1 Tax=Petrolisthes manimaculis TaxID=1843537 RepID=A0AAE1PKF6_9EUCA|nr:hypothetical protein Pmani_018138 [Petrolisthes manimaculis]